MTREERMRRQAHNWLRKTGYSYGNARAGGAPIPESAKRHMHMEPYGMSYSAKRIRVGDGEM